MKFILAKTWHDFKYGLRYAALVIGSLTSFILLLMLAAYVQVTYLGDIALIFWVIGGVLLALYFVFVLILIAVGVETIPQKYPYTPYEEKTR